MTITITLLLTPDPLLTGLLEKLIHKGGQIVATLQDLTAQVQSNTDAEASAAQLLQNLSDLLKAAGTDPTALGDIITQLDTSRQTLAAAIVANTPAAAQAQSAKR